MERDFHGKLVLVTGGARGVGKAIAQQFAARGAHLLINFFHSLDAAKQTKAELEAAGATADILRASVAQPSQVDRMFEEIEARYGYLDILVNNAASGAFAAVDEIREEHFARALDTNLKGAFWCSRHAARLMKRRHGGAIVNISSVGAGLVPANYLVVGTSKAALESLTRYLAVEFAPHNIRVNTASATMIDGEVARMFPGYESMRRNSEAHTPLGRIGSPEDLAHVVTFLASDRASWMTGQMVLADGGLSMNAVALSPTPGEVSRAVGHSTPIPDPASRTVHSGAATAAPSTPDRSASAGPEPPTDAAAHHGDRPVAGIDVPETDDIAVVGMGLVVPGASDPAAFWRILMERPELFSEVPDDRWDFRAFYSPDASAPDKSYQSRSVFVTDGAAGTSPAEENAAAGASVELTTRWLRRALVQALAGVSRRPSDRFSFTVGYTADGSQHLEEATVLAGTLQRLEAALRDAPGSTDGPLPLFAEIRRTLEQRYWRGAGGTTEFLPHRVGQNAMGGVLPDGTELIMVDTACSSSLYAVDIGMKGLMMGTQDIAVCGGSFALGPRGSVLFAKLHGLSESGEVRPLDATCDGVLFADGAGVVVLKRLARAVADGDRVLGIIRGVGSSSDGKGKAIYAPSAAGQSLAIDRALSDAGLDADQIEWIVAHATGTPAGDMAEFTTLKEKIVARHPVYVTSNKSLIGHTGWAAGVASLIQVLLALEHETIPPQHRFTSPPPAFGIEQTMLRIPTEPVPWPKRADRPRVASVSGFGFGGTNAHLVIEEYLPQSPRRPKRRQRWTERLAIVGWSAHVPELDRRGVISWLAGGASATPPGRSFGDIYPLPPFERVRMPPAVLRAIDRCQLMVVECAHELKSQMPTFWNDNTERIGVFMGHMGPTRSATLYASRCYLDDLEAAVLAGPAGQQPSARALLASLRQEVERLVLPSNENSFPGMMPNVIPARIANYFDLKGLNMTVDTGYSSALTAFDVAGRYLRSGELTLALVGATNGNVTPEMAHLVDESTDRLAEGAFLFALATEDVALQSGLPILAFLDVDPPPPNEPTPIVHCGGGRVRPNYLGAEGAVGVLTALQASPPSGLIICGDRTDSPARLLAIQPPLPADAAADRAAEIAVAATESGERPVPAPFHSATHVDAQTPLDVQRYEAVFALHRPTRLRDEIGFCPPGTIVVTDRPDLIDACPEIAADTLVIATVPVPPHRPRWLAAPECDSAAIGQWLSGAGTAISHVRIVSDLQARLGERSLGDEATAAAIALHDLGFVVLKHAFDGLAAGPSSIAALLLDAVAAGTLHPVGGLFSGLLKSTALELPRCVTVGVFTSARTLAAGVRQTTAETAYGQYLPVVLYDGEERRTLFVDAVPGALAADAAARIGPGSVVVAIGGARGITAELMKAVAEHFQPELYLVGSNPLDRYPASLFDGSDEEFARQRPQYIRTQRLAAPDKTLATINKEFERILEARKARANIDTMRRWCGADRVHYIECDVRNRAALTSAMAAIIGRHGAIDLLVNAPGINRSASIPQKSLQDFRAVRDIKVEAYRNLKAATRHAPPRMWCNFGSFIGLTGQLGETDYASGNDFLAASALHARRTGSDEFTIGWTLWGEVGLGSNPVTKAFLEKSGLFTSMSTSTGVHHFVREINLPARAASVIHLGAAERKAITDHIPDYFTARDAGAPAAPSPAPALPPPGRPAPATFYLGRTLAQQDDEILIERVFSLETDAYLADHLVNGYATLPGTFVPEVAAEAALRLVPGLTVIGFEDAVFHHFLRVYDKNRPSPKKIHARIVRTDGGQTAVRVRVLTDIVGPNGMTLQRDKLHFEITVMLAAAHPDAPRWERWPTVGAEPIIDPYHVPTAPVLLRGPFVSTRDTCAHPLGKTATYQLNVPADHPVFASFVVPSILLDGLARIAVLTRIAGDYIPLAAPAAIRRIDVYEPGNDCDVAARYPEIRFYATPRDLSLDDHTRGNRFVAVRPDGRMIMQMKDVAGVIIGYVHATSGAYLSPAEMSRQLETTAAPVRVPTGR